MKTLLSSVLCLVGIVAFGQNTYHGNFNGNGGPNSSGSGLTNVNAVSMVNSNAVNPTQVDTFPSVSSVPGIEFNDWVFLQPANTNLSSVLSPTLLTNYVTFLTNTAPFYGTNASPGSVWYCFDDMWQNSTRDANGHMNLNGNFDSTLNTTNLAGYVAWLHANGFKVRLYLSYAPSNSTSCMGLAGTDDAHLLTDIRDAEAAGFDGLKFDLTCSGLNATPNGEVYAIRKIKQAIRQVGFPFSVCGTVSSGDENKQPLLEHLTWSDSLNSWQPGGGTNAPGEWHKQIAYQDFTNFWMPYITRPGSNVYSMMTSPGHYWQVGAIAPYATPDASSSQMGLAGDAMFSAWVQLGSTNGYAVTNLANPTFLTVLQDPLIKFPKKTFGDSHIQIFTKTLADSNQVAYMVINTNTAWNTNITFDMFGLPTNSAAGWAFYRVTSAFVPANTSIYSNSYAFNFSDGTAASANPFDFGIIRRCQITTNIIPWYAWSYDGNAVKLADATVPAPSPSSWPVGVKIAGNTSSAFLSYELPWDTVRAGFEFQWQSDTLPAGLAWTNNFQPLYIDLTGTRQIPTAISVSTFTPTGGTPYTNAFTFCDLPLNYQSQRVLRLQPLTATNAANRYLISSRVITVRP